MIPNLNDGSNRPPYLRIDLEAGTLDELPDSLPLSQKTKEEQYQFFKGKGFSGFQNGQVALCKNYGFNYSISGWIGKPGDTAPLVEKAREEGNDGITLHAGNGFESDDEAFRLLEDILNISQKNNYPVYLETHRSTITQDMVRTLGFIQKFPEIRFNGDFSHWYTGQEMRYRKFSFIEEKLEYLSPVFERVRFMHGRMGNGGCMQVSLDNQEMQQHIPYFQKIWTLCFEGFIKSASPGDFIIFAPELLSPNKGYAREFQDDQGRAMEEGNRIEDALLYKEIAEACWEKAYTNQKT